MRIRLIVIVISRPKRWGVLKPFFQNLSFRLLLQLLLYDLQLIKSAWKRKCKCLEIDKKNIAVI